MQYHLEHHLYPAVPFFNLPKLRKTIEHDLPVAPHGLRATWQEMLDLRRKLLVDPDFKYMPSFPANGSATTTSPSSEDFRFSVV